MNVGMLWLAHASESLTENVRKAAAYYEKKYGRTPDLCLVHPSMMGSESEPVNEVGGVTVRSWRPVLPGTLWIGVDLEPEYVQHSRKANERQEREKVTEGAEVSA